MIRAKRVNGWRLVIFAVVTAVLLIGVFWLRVAQTSESDAQLCRKVDRLDAALLGFVSHSKPPKPHEYGYAYWRIHHKTEPLGAPGGKPPPALIALLKSAACDPSNLPSQGGKP